MKHTPVFFLAALLGCSLLSESCARDAKPRAYPVKQHRVPERQHTSAEAPLPPAADAPAAESVSLSPQVPEPPVIFECVEVPAVQGLVKNARSNDMENLSLSFEVVEQERGEDVMVQTPSVRAGLLTAGEIHDFSKWRLWEDIAANELGLFQQQWQLYPHERYCTAVQTDRGTPLPGARVELYSTDGAVLWTAVTDNNGIAECWNRMFNASDPREAASIKVSAGGEHRWIQKIKPIAKGINAVTMPVACEVSGDVDILWCVDATGSMGDEIDYLKAELDDIIGKTAAENTDLEIRTGSIFYRCQGNSYTTRTSPFSASLAVTRDFIRQQTAAEGGTEAVEVAMTEAMALDWRSAARARIMFMVLDECPGREQEVIDKLHAATAQAAASGIRIVPLVSSGVDFSADKSLEYLMRSLALATNGTYAFLTDHSGIGNSHTAPSTNRYKVEALNELLLRIIRQYTFFPGCPDDPAPLDLAQVLADPETQPAADNFSLTLRPNPARINVIVETSEAPDALWLTDNSGKWLMRSAFPGQTLSLDVTDFPSGLYFIKASKGERWAGERLVIAR